MNESNAKNYNFVVQTQSPNWKPNLPTSGSRHLNPNMVDQRSFEKSQRKNVSYTGQPIKEKDTRTRQQIQRDIDKAYKKFKA